MKRFLNLIVGFTPLKIAIAFSLFFIVLSLIFKIALLDFLDQRWVDFIQQRHGKIDYSDQIVIAVVDTKSIDTYGRWPWSRKIIADMIKELNEYYQVKTIGFDIVFSEPEAQNLEITKKYRQEFEKTGLHLLPEGKAYLDTLSLLDQELDGDLQLAEQLNKFSNIVMGYVFFNSEEDTKHLAPETIDQAQERILDHGITIMGDTNDLKQRLPKEEIFPALTISRISNEGNMIGFFNIASDLEDGIVRRIHLIRHSRDNFYPALSLRMLAHYWETGIELEVREDALMINLGENLIELGLSEGFLLINFKGPQKTFSHYSIADIIDHKIPIGDLKDKLVLVGITDVGLLDQRVTPVGGDYPGVEVHANIIDNLLTDSYYKIGFWNRGFTILLILLTGVFLGLVLPRVRLEYGAIIFILLLIGYTFFHQFCVIEFLTWPSYIYVTLNMILIFISVSQYMFFVSDKDKRFIKNAFQQYLSPTVIDVLTEDPEMLTLGGEEKVTTALFSDIKGFSGISENLTPHELVMLLNDYLTEMAEIILENGGTVDKFIGDAIVAFFGAPVEFSDHPKKSVLVGLEMDRRLKEMRPIWKEKYGVEVFHRIGLNTGPMIVGNMGSRTRFDYTIMGNSVNLAARLEGVNKQYGTSLVMSQMTYEKCQEDVDVRKLDLIQVMGITKPVEIYEIICKKGELSEQQRTAFNIFENGLSLYQKMQWDEALSKFQEVHQHLPQDGPSSTFIQRCLQFKATPPQSDWDGVFQMVTK